MGAPAVGRRVDSGGIPVSMPGGPSPGGGSTAPGARPAALGVCAAETQADVGAGALADPAASVASNRLFPLALDVALGAGTVRGLGVEAVDEALAAALAGTLVAGVALLASLDLLDMGFDLTSAFRGEGASAVRDLAAGTEAFGSAGFADDCAAPDADADAAGAVAGAGVGAVAGVGPVDRAGATEAADAAASSAIRARASATASVAASSPMTDRMAELVSSQKVAKMTRSRGSRAARGSTARRSVELAWEADSSRPDPAPLSTPESPGRPPRPPKSNVMPPTVPAVPPPRRRSLLLPDLDDALASAASPSAISIAAVGSASAVIPKSARRASGRDIRAVSAAAMSARARFRMAATADG